MVKWSKNMFIEELHFKNANADQVWKNVDPDSMSYKL